MTTMILSLFATMVLTLNAWSATDVPLGENLEIEKNSSEKEYKKPSSNYEFDLAPVEKRERPSTSEADKPAYLTKNYSFNPNLSFGYSSEEYQIYSLGFQYLNFKNTLKSEWAFNLYNQGSASISLSRKWFFFHWESIQAHTKLGASLYMDPSQGIATIVDIRNFGFNAQIGFEKLLKQPLSFRGDIDFIATQSAIIVMLQMGYSWAW